MTQSCEVSRRPESITIEPVSAASGTVRLPGSKSISNRALFLAAMAQGKTTLTGLLRADDTERMIEALQALGIEVAFEADTQVTVTGCGGRIPVKSGELFIGNAGTAARTLTALLAFAGGTYRLDGIARMRERPIGDLLEALRSLGAKVTCEVNDGFLPLRFEPARCEGNRVSVRGNVSSQYLTALLMLAPSVASDEGFWIDIEGELISRPYVAMTVRMMCDFGIEAKETSTGFWVPRGTYRAQSSYKVEADASAASYFLALGALTGGPVTITGVGKDSMQGDVAFADALETMGAVVEKTDDSITVRRDKKQPLKGLRLDCTAIPDAAMTFVPMALMTQGAVQLTGIGSWRVKETDRLAAMACEMRKFGAVVQEGPDFIVVSRSEEGMLKNATVDTYDDHRMAMSLALAACAGVTVTVNDPGCTAKTYPDYFEAFGRLTAHR